MAQQVQNQGPDMRVNKQHKIKYSLDQQDLCQNTKSGHFKGGRWRWTGEGSHHAVNNIRHQTQQNQRSNQHKPRLPLEGNGPPWRSPLELILSKQKNSMQVWVLVTQLHCCTCKLNNISISLEPDLCFCVKSMQSLLVSYATEYTHHSSCVLCRSSE